MAHPMALIKVVFNSLEGAHNNGIAHFASWKICNLAKLYALVFVLRISEHSIPISEQ